VYESAGGLRNSSDRSPSTADLLLRRQRTCSISFAASRRAPSSSPTRLVSALTPRSLVCAGVCQKMPQTSLLSFLTSAVSVDSGSLPALKVVRAPLRRAEGGLNINDSLARKETQPSERSAGGPISAKLNNHDSTSSLATSLKHETHREAVSVRRPVKEEGEQEWEDATRTISNPLSTTPPGSSTIFTLPDYPSIAITTIQPAHLPPLKRLTTTLLPIKYPDIFYTESISDPTASPISHVALYTPQDPSSSPRPIGWIRCSLSPLPSPSPQIFHHQIYIKTLCLLAPYRHIGVATALLDSILDQTEFLREQNVQSVFAHVWESNEEALEWYVKRGFEKEEELIQRYYRRLRPAGAWVVRKEVNV